MKSIESYSYHKQYIILTSLYLTKNVYNLTFILISLLYIHFVLIYPLQIKSIINL